MPAPQLLTMAEAARVLRRSITAVNTMVRDGRWPSDEVPIVMFGGRRHVRRADLESFIGGPSGIDEIKGLDVLEAAS